MMRNALLMTLVGLMLVWSSIAYATPPVHPCTEIFKLYEQGRIDEARAKLRSHVVATLKSVKDSRSLKAIDIQGKLGASVTLVVIQQCFDLERQYGPKGTTGIELLEVAQMAREAVDIALADAQAAGEALGKQTPKILEGITYAKGQKAKLLVKEIASLRDSGQNDKAREMANANANFLKEAGVNIDDVLAPGDPIPGPSKKAEVITGQQLAILQLLVDFYRALSEEDPKALDALLCKGGGLARGEDLLQQLADDRKARKRFDRIGVARFDTTSRVEILPKGRDEYEVKCYSVFKSVQLGDKILVQHEMDRYLVRVVDGQHKLVVRAKKEGEKHD